MTDLRQIESLKPQLETTEAEKQEILKLWAESNDAKDAGQLMETVLYILLIVSTPIPCEMVVEIAERDECDVKKVLDKWDKYLRKQDVQGKTCYGIYHIGFLDFLKGQQKVDSKRTLFKNVRRRIVDYLEKEMM